MALQGTLPEVLERLRHQATSPDPNERAAATKGLETILEEDFDAVFDGTQEWALDSDERLREVVVRACSPTSPTIEDFAARRLFSRVELFLADPSALVIDACAGEVVPALIGANPTVGIPWLKEWTHNTDEPVRASIALSLAGIAGRFPADAIEGLSELHTDPRPVVRRAVAQSVAMIKERNPPLRHALESRFPARADEY